MSFTADTGDLYLNVQNHVAMCQTQVPDVLSEFYINEHGTITGGQIGDQTGGESWVRAYYSFPWDGILHYNGQADFEEDDMSILTYKNPSMNGDKDVYQLLTDIHDQVTRTDTAGWDNPDGHDIFGRVQMIEKDVREIKEALGGAPIEGEPVEAEFELSEDDVDAIAEAVADKLAARMAQ